MLQLRVPLKDYLAVVERVYIPIREMYNSSLASMTALYTSQADELVLQVNAQAVDRPLNDQDLAEIRAIKVSLDAAIERGARELDRRRWELYSKVLDTIRRAAKYALKGDSAAVENVIRFSGYGHEGFAAEPRHSWDDIVYAMLLRLYEISQV